MAARVDAALRTLRELRSALAAQPRTEQVLNRIADLCREPETAKTCESLMTPTEKEQLRKALIAAAAVEKLNQLDKVPLSPTNKLAIAKTYYHVSGEGIVLPTTLNWSKIRIAVEFMGRWNALTQALAANDEVAIFEAWNPAQMYDALELLSDEDKVTLLRAVKNTSRRERLENALASDDAQRVAFAKRELSDPVDVTNSTASSVDAIISQSR
jgi:hypothetical protein